MLQPRRPQPGILAFVCHLFTAYALIITLCAPFSLHRVEARTAVKNRASAAAATTAAATVANPATLKKAKHRDGELIVRFRQGVSDDYKNLLATSKGGRRKGRLRGRSNLERLELPADLDVEQLALALRQLPEIELAEPNYLVERADTTPDDARLSEQWALHNTGATAGSVAGADIRALSAWDRTTGTSSTVVAIVDSGIDFTHPDLQSNRWTNAGEQETSNNTDDEGNGYTDDRDGWDWVGGDNDPRDEQGHGTMVAGIIAAEGNNATGIAGVMWRAGLMNLRVLDNTGTGDVANAVEAIDYAVANGARVINCSWGTDGESVALREAVERAAQANVVVVASAGNSARDTDVAAHYPASYRLSNVIGVAASDAADNLAAFSNWGATTVTVAAPGKDILTTRMGGGYTTMQGTSAAAPMVAGIAGLIKTERWWLSGGGTRQAIVDGARSSGGLTGKVSAGGVADAAGALAALQGPNTPPPGSGSAASGGGGGNQTPPVSPPGRGGGSSAPTTPPTPQNGSTGAGLPNLDEARRVRPGAPQAPTPIKADNILPVCDLDCGGSGGLPVESGSTPNDPNMGGARTEPQNETGQPGVDLGSRNFNWSSGLVSLAGRAGMNMNLALFYNSLIWTRSGNTMRFNADRGTPSPGFRLDMPTLQPQYYDAASGTYAYLMITPSGGRVEMRRVGASNTYEAADGSHAQLTIPRQLYRITARHSGKSLDVPYASQSNGVQLAQYGYVGGTNQQFYIEDTGIGYFKIIARHSGKAVEVDPYNSGGNGARVQQNDYTGGFNQQWQRQWIASPDYEKIVSLQSGKLLDVQGGTGATGDGTAIQQWQYTNVNQYNQHWQLVPVGYDGDTVLRTADGTQYTFVAGGDGAMHCTQIKDRNGNFISATYNNLGRLTSVTDTLGRVVSFNYDAQNYLTSVTQSGRAKPWAEFFYSPLTIGHNFQENGTPLAVEGPANGTSIPVLTQVNFPDGSYTRFEYNSWGQVTRVVRFGQLSPHGALSYTKYNLPPDATTPQTDCPRFTERRDWVLWGVMNASQEVLTTYSAAADGSSSQVTTPDGTVHKELFATTGWQKGLTAGSETWVGGVMKKWTTTAWTQDDESLGYQKNPRPIEINIYDADNNRKRTTIDYITTNGISLPRDVREYGGANASTVLRRTNMTYRWDAVYLDRRIIGLSDTQQVFEGENTLVSKIENHYDWTNYFKNESPAVGHDGANYPATFIVGRANLAGTRRYDVNARDDVNRATWLSVYYYNAAGLPVSTHDGGHNSVWNVTNISYADSFSDGNNGRNTLAYPTTITDPDNYSSTAQYDFTTGQVTRAQDPKGAVTTTQYDTVGRAERVTTDDGDGNANNNPYTRWEYPNENLYRWTFSKVQEGAAEVVSGEHFDGVGRVRAVDNILPNSAGGYSAVHYMYDNMGRRVWASNPTEITAAWQPTGDDSGGWKWTVQAYDWQSRPTVTTNADGTTTEATYGGCGCAGGAVTSVRDERGRRRRMTKDTLGRLIRTEEFNWDGRVHATADYTYNGRDQLTQISHLGQIRAMEYDGHGRLAARVTPEQGRTTYSYFNNDTTQTVRDARGATTTFDYNNRDLPTSITFGTPSGVAATANVAFTYDQTGNRTSMTDGLGTTTYAYDTLSRLTSETRTFNGVAGSFPLTYGYNMAGQVTSVKNPWNVTVGYPRDATGRVTAVTNTGYGGFGNYTNDIRYRAFGAIKAATYGNGKAYTAGFDNRLRMTNWDVAGVAGAEYRYTDYGENTGRVTYARDTYDATLDRAYNYDHVGRLVESYTGAQARSFLSTGNPNAAAADGIYGQVYWYDARGNLTTRGGWGGQAWSYPTVAFNDKNQATHHVFDSSPTAYDAAGNMTSDGWQSFAYDATGQQTQASWNNTEMNYDGDRLRLKRTQDGQTTLYLRSSVMGGQVIAEMNAQGSWTRGYVYGADGGLVTMQQPEGYLEWVTQDPVTKSQRLTNAAGAITTVVELDPFGGEAARSVNTHRQPHLFTTYTRDANGADEAMHRRYNRWNSRFLQPDPYDGSYDLTNPQSFNRYSYVENDPVNFTDPSGLDPIWLENENVDVIASAYDPFDDPFFRGVGGIGWSFTPLPMPSLPGVVNESVDVIGSLDPPTTEPQQRNPCDISDIVTPEGVDVNRNIAAAQKVNNDYWVFENKLSWFQGMVRNAKGRVDDVRAGRSWDYKQLGDQFKAFGNFNYGATGAVLTSSDKLLLSEAGRAQRAAGTSKPEWNYPTPIKGTVIGGKPPYGDDPDDQVLIQRGIDYYRAGCHNR